MKKIKQRVSPLALFFCLALLLTSCGEKKLDTVEEEAGPVLVAAVNGCSVTGPGCQLWNNWAGDITTVLNNCHTETSNGCPYTGTTATASRLWGSHGDPFNIAAGCCYGPATVNSQIPSYVNFAKQNRPANTYVSVQLMTLNGYYIDCLDWLIGSYNYAYHSTQQHHIPYWRFQETVTYRQVKCRKFVAYTPHEFQSVEVHTFHSGGFSEDPNDPRGFFLVGEPNGNLNGVSVEFVVDGHVLESGSADPSEGPQTWQYIPDPSIFDLEEEVTINVTPM